MRFIIATILQSITLAGLIYLIYKQHKGDRKIMANQEQLESLVASANDSLAKVSQDLTDIKNAIQAETQQIADFIANKPDALDTTSLEGFVTNLTAATDKLATVAEGVSGIFTPPAEPAPVEPPVTEPPVAAPTEPETPVAPTAPETPVAPTEPPAEPPADGSSE